MREQSRLWSLLKSLWILPTFFPLGTGSFLSFLFIGIRKRNLKWMIAGFIYLISIYGLLMTLGSIKDMQRWVAPFTITILCIWATSIVHASWLNRANFKVIFRRHKNELRHQVYTKAEISKVQQESAQDYYDMNKKPQALNINKASEKEISGLPGIHSFLAKSIIHARNEGESFENIEQLIQSINIKPHILNKALPYIAFSDHELKTLHKQAQMSEQQKSTIYTKSKGRRVDY